MTWRAPRPSRLTFASLVALVAISASSSHERVAAQSPQSQTPVFRAKLELIQVDVTVLGPDGRPLRGLTAADFTLLDEGVEQPIRGFAEIYIPDSADGPEWLKTSSPDVRTASDGRVLVFVLDDAQIRYDLYTQESIAIMRRVADEVIDRMGPTDVAAVICTYDDKCSQEFTSDRALLRAAVAKFSPKATDTTGGLGSWQLDWSRQTAGVTQSIVQYLIEQPGRRKSLIYVSPGIPVRPKIWPPIACPAEDCTRLEQAVTQQQVMKAFEDAFKSKVTVYGISPRGLRAILADENPDLLAVKPAELQLPRARVSEPDRSLATETGGFIVAGAENLEEGVAQIFRETGSYYLLGYEKPTNAVTEYHPIAGYRTLEIKVNRPDVTVRGRFGYVVPKPAKPVKNPPAPGDSALAGILPKTDLPLRVTVVPIVTPGQRDVTVLVVVGATEPSPSSRTVERLDVLVRAFTPRGEPRGMTRQQVDVRLPAGRDAEVLFEGVALLKLKPGLHSIRVSAVSERMGLAGSVYTDVDVPDFSKMPLSVSGVAVSATPGPLVTRNDTIGALIPAMPTTMRDFKRAQHVRAFLRIYQIDQREGPAPVTITARIFDASDRVVAERTDTLEPERFGASRSANYSYDLPLSTLADGLHLLTLQTDGGGQSIRRDVRFTVK